VPKLAANLILAVVAFALELAIMEGAGRAWVAWRWPPNRAYQMTHSTPTRGAFESHPTLGYMSTRGFDLRERRHDDRGFRSDPVADERIPGVARFAALGGSTVYGSYVSNDETFTIVLRDLLQERGLSAEAINAGVPGWTSRESVISWEERIRPLRPDAIILMDGRNDAFPQLWQHYRPDYSHYRDVGYQVVNSNAKWKKRFRWSYVLMVLVTRFGLFDFDPRAEHPLYGSVRWENKPTVIQANASSLQPERGEALPANLRRIALDARRHGVATILVTLPHWAEGYRSGTLPEREGYLDAVMTRVHANNDAVRTLGRELGIPVIEGASLSSSDFLFDDCHYNATGHRRLAAALLPALERVLATSRSSRPELRQ